MKRARKIGFTLIEIILAMAILGILAVAFMPILGNGFITVFDMGSRTKAMATAQQLIDSGEFDNKPSEIIQYTDYNLMLSKPYTPGEDNIGRYCIRSSTITIPQLSTDLTSKSYNTVTVMVYFGNKKQYVLLTHIIE